MIIFVLQTNVFTLSQTCIYVAALPRTMSQPTEKLSQFNILTNFECFVLLNI